MTLQNLIQYCLTQGLTLDENYNLTIDTTHYPVKNLVEPFLENGQFNHLNFDVEHLYNQVIIPVIIHHKSL